MLMSKVVSNHLNARDSLISTTNKWELHHSVVHLEHGNVEPSSLHSS